MQSGTTQLRPDSSKKIGSYRLGWTCAKCGRRVHNPRRTPPRCCKRAMVNDALLAGQLEMIDMSTPAPSVTR